MKIETPKQDSGAVLWWNSLQLGFILYNYLLHEFYWILRQKWMLYIWMVMLWIYVYVGVNKELE